MRDIHIDTLRGLACILLVSYHVIGDTPNNGLQVESGLLRELNDLFSSVRMPLFTFLSGLVYASRPLEDNWPRFIKGKIRRLIIPMLFVGTIFAIVQFLVPGTNNSIENWWLLHIYPVQHFWFVEALFWVFLFIIPFELSRSLHKKTIAALLIFIFVICSLLQPLPKLLSFHGFVYLMPFFLLGLSIRRFGIKTFAPKHSLIMFILFMFSIYMFIDEKHYRDLTGCIIGIVSCYLLFGIKFSNDFLSRIGIYSYSIYIFHVFFTAGSRIIASKAMDLDTIYIFLISLASGIIGPIIIFHISKKSRKLHLLTTGNHLKTANNNQ